MGNLTKQRENGTGGGKQGEGNVEVSPAHSSLRRNYRLSPAFDIAGYFPLVEWAIAVEEEALASSLRYECFGICESVSNIGT